MPNGIWIEKCSFNSICWYDNQNYMTHTENFFSARSNIPFLRAYFYLYFETLGKNKLFSQIKKKIQIKTNNQFKYQTRISLKNISIVRALILIIVIYYLTNIEIVLFSLFSQSLPVLIANTLSSLTEFWFIIFFLLFAIRLFISTEQINKFSRLNQAFKQLTLRYYRHNAVFMTILLLMVFISSNLFSGYLGVNIFFMIVIILPIIYEILSYCENHLDNYICFLIYFPIYIIDRYFTKTPTKKELKCVTLALGSR